MGMYTELIFGASLKKDTPTEIIDTIKYMVGDIEKPESLAFDLGRNPLLGGSYYFGVNSPVTKFYKDEISKEWVLSSRANIKNYNNEIEQFLTWIKPYISNGSGGKNMYAIVMYEESEEPTIYYLNQ